MLPRTKEMLTHWKSTSQVTENAPVQDHRAATAKAAIPTNVLTQPDAAHKKEYSQGQKTLGIFLKKTV